jgi:hypothetical protein
MAAGKGVHASAGTWRACYRRTSWPCGAPKRPRRDLKALRPWGLGENDSWATAVPQAPATRGQSRTTTATRGGGIFRVSRFAQTSPGFMVMPVDRISWDGRITRPNLLASPAAGGDMTSSGRGFPFPGRCPSGSGRREPRLKPSKSSQRAGSIVGGMTAGMGGGTAWVGGRGRGIGD